MPNQTNQQVQVNQCNQQSQQNQPQEKEWAGAILYLQKLEATTLCSTALESANPQVRNHATNLLNKSLQQQSNLFNLMSQKGWYKVEAAPKDQFTRTQQSFNTMLQQQNQGQQCHC